MNSKCNRSTIMEEMEESDFSTESTISAGMDMKSILKKMQQMEAELLVLKRSNLDVATSSSSIQLAMETGRQFKKVEDEILELKKAVAILRNKENLADDGEIQKDIRELRRQNLEMKRAIGILGNKDAASKGKIVGLKEEVGKLREQNLELKDEVGKLRDEILAIKEQAPSNVSQQNGQTMQLEQPEPAANGNNENLDGNSLIVATMSHTAAADENESSDFNVDDIEFDFDIDKVVSRKSTNDEEEDDKERESADGDEEMEMELNFDEEEGENLDENEKEDEPALKHKKQGQRKGYGRSNSTQCEICGKRMASADYLHYKHLKLHTGKGLNPCTICPKKFIHPKDLRNHMLKHNGEKPFKCNICEKRYSYKSALNLHMKQVHCGNGTPAAGNGEKNSRN